MTLHWNRYGRVMCGTIAALLLAANVASAASSRSAPPPPPDSRRYDYQPPDDYGDYDEDGESPGAPPRPYYPAPVVQAPPPPLSPLMRVIYAPFYAAGLVLRYGVYYAVVAPFEVFGRTLSYGVDAGVEGEPQTTDSE